VAELHFRGVDWRAVTDGLLAYTKKLFRTAGLLDQMITGKTANDFVAEAIVRLVDPRDTTIEWDAKRGKPTTDSVMALLREVIRRDFIDAKKVPRYTKTRAIDDEKKAHDVTAAGKSPEETAVERVDRNRIRDQLLAFIGDRDPDVVAYLSMQLSDDGVVGYPPRKAAQLLNTTVQEINNRKKRVAGYLKEFEASREESLYAR
jgi:DNA-directed RNA polymerase specialized sigma24 family protein